MGQSGDLFIVSEEKRGEHPPVEQEYLLGGVGVRAALAQSLDQAGQLRLVLGGVAVPRDEVDDLESEFRVNDLGLVHRFFEEAPPTVEIGSF
ncbi:MAG: hypothetical protein WCJ64_13415 [Rhodospirillaceae bacterium]